MSLGFPDQEPRLSAILSEMNKVRDLVHPQNIN